MQLSDFKDKRITVMGIGLHGGGVGVIKFLAAQGAKVLATDLQKKEELTVSLKELTGQPRPKKTMFPLIVILEYFLNCAPRR
ncbi:MAG: UDP-N-acetylmuramoylalanine-D-glutamate ligase [Parcubacteria group bacterium GW2011_GWA2_43_9b]|nr:MAG: UDP-N-acetylmuramoylalanine-D-glutamate ligase [Parcubacteria group bacterium GW2011_GWA2_43_9b]